MFMKNLLKFLGRLNSIRIGILITLIMVVVIYRRPMSIEALENRAYDLRFRLRRERRADPNIVLVLIDEKTVEKLGRWPFPRIYWAQFFNQMAKYQPKVVALDVIFSEHDQNINTQFMEKLKAYYLTEGSAGLKEKTGQLIQLVDQEIGRAMGKPDLQAELGKIKDGLLALPPGQNDQVVAYIDDLEKQANTDQAMTDALAQLNNDILGWFFFQTANEAAQTPPQENLARLELLKPYAISTIRYKYGSDARTMLTIYDEQGRPVRTRVPAIYGFQSNLPMFMKNISGSGFFTSVSDSDGVLRSAPLIAAWPKFDPNLKPEDYLFFPSLALEVLRVYLGESPMVVVNESGVESIRVGPYRAPVDEGGRMLINWQGNLDKFPNYSLADVINDFAEQRKKNNFNPESAFKDKIVLVGPTAVGIYDIWSTPFGTFPGVMSHANIIDNILKHRELYRPNWMYAFDILIIAVLGMFLSWIYPKLKPLYSASLVLVLIVGYWAVNYYMVFSSASHLSLTLVYPTLSLLFIYLGVTIYHYTMEEKEKRFIRNAFGLYMSKEVIEELCADPAKLKLGGEEKRVTVFFSDIKGFTSISEKLPTEKLVHLLNMYLTEMSDIVLANRGTVDKYIGDAVMAIFGAPVDYPDHAKSACLSSIAMHKRLDELNQQWAAEGWPEVRCRIGLNTGAVKVGNMGSVRRMDYTAIGDEVNLASRLESANKQYGTKLMCSEATLLEAQDVIETRELDLLAVVGKQKPVRVFEILCKKGQLDPHKKEVIELYARGLELYRGRRFEQAMMAFQKALELDPADSPSKVYLERSEGYRQSPPAADWDGVFRLTKK